MSDWPDLWVTDAYVTGELTGVYRAPRAVDTPQPSLYAVRAEFTPVTRMHVATTGQVFRLSGVARVGLDVPEWGGRFTHWLAWEADGAGTSYRVESVADPRLHNTR